MNITRLLSILIALSSFIFVGCKQGSAPKQYRIAFSQCVSSDSWRVQMEADMHRQAALLSDVELIVRNAEGSTQKQMQDIKELLELGIDALIISPNESEPLTELVNIVFKSGIAVVVVDRKIENDNFSAYVGADNIEIGRIAGEVIEGFSTKDTTKIAEVWGLMGSSPARERHQGLIARLSGDTGAYKLLELHGDWTGASITNEIVEDLLKYDPDAIFAHNDFMAAEIAKRLSAKNVNKPIIGVDGLSSPGGGMELVKNGTLISTVLYPTGGSEALDICYRILTGENYIKSNKLEAIAITKNNVNLLLAQSNKTIELQQLIHRQNSAILDGERVLSSQRKRSLLLISLVVLIAITSIALFFFLWRNNNINRKLASQNQKLEDQRQKLELLSSKQKIATDEKLRFFTNVSHELKTPLSLIKVPLEELLKTAKDPSTKGELNLALKSTQRLVSLVDDLLDFRKIESKGIQLRTYDVNLATYFEVFYKEFSIAAKRLKIDFTYSDELNVEHAVFDPEAIDKIISNLLSNAFKFTPESGNIQFELSNSLNNLKIRVVDSGTGIQKRHLPFIFDRYYQGNRDLFPGFGLGLALSKELVELHNGSIQVETEIGQGTIFTVKIPLERFENEQVIYIGGTPSIYLQKRAMPIAEKIKSLSPRAERELNKIKPNLILVEDDHDFGKYLQGKLSGRYNTFWFKDVKSALNHLKLNKADVIITDIMLPGINGVELVRELRSNEDTRSIPIIVLTALNNDQVRIDVKRLNVEEYLAKPFSFELLISSIEQLIKRDIGPTDNNEKSLKYRINAIIQENYKDPNFGTGELAEAVGMSRVQLYRKTKDLYKDTIGSVINSARLTAAHELILESTLRMSEISDRCGFSSASYFSKSIKMKYGFSPNQLRQQAQKY